MIELLASPWRSRFRGFLASVDRSLLVAAPFIQLREMAWVTRVLLESHGNTEVELTLLTSIRADSVMSGTLQVEALIYAAEHFSVASVINVPALHAKVYVADEQRAIVTSANLTTAGLDRNAEYGVFTDAVELAGQINADLRAYGTLGGVVDLSGLREISGMAADLDREHSRQRSAESLAFTRKVADLTTKILVTQVGNRTAHAYFADAIKFLLRDGPSTTQELHRKIQQLLPELCDDSKDLILNGQRFGKWWKYKVRTAQATLRRAGVIAQEGDRWHLV